jgi:ATP-dependent exoDNAse (exonuclease V) beta subunit
MLSQKNKHERDDRISFEEKTHTYYVDGSSDGIISTTTLIHRHFPKFDADRILKLMKNKNEKYPNMSDEEIKLSWQKNGKNASENGTRIHKMIENYYNGITNEEYLKDTKEFEYFLRFNETIKDKFEPYRTEWSVFDGNIDLAGQIDMLYKKKDGTYALYDWKRVKEIKKENIYEKGLGSLKDLDHCNYIHYSIQLNIYKRILETRYNMKVSDMALVIIHPDNDNYILENVKDISKYIDIIFNERLKELE